jgi:coenzyme PQQ synthesis protein D (PqqD)
MQAAPGLHVEWVDDEAVVLNPGSSELHYLNRSAALVFALILEYGFQEAMSRVELTFYESTSLEEELEALIAELVEKGLLTDAQ